MEKQRSDNGRRNREAGAKDSLQFRLQCASSLPSVERAPPSPANELKLARIAVDLNVRLRSADMPPAMQERAIRRTRALVDSNPDKNKRPNPTQLAMWLKKEFDPLYGPAWHCFVGKSLVEDSCISLWTSSVFFSSRRGSVRLLNLLRCLD